MFFTIDKLRQVDNDGWLGDLHTLLLMDNTVVLSANRTSLLEKLHVLHAAAIDIGMDIHPYKSQYIAVNPGDTSPIILDNVCVFYQFILLSWNPSCRRAVAGTNFLTCPQ